MINFLCDSCHRPIKPQEDNHINVADMTICFSGKVGRFTLQFCGKGCFVTWLNRNGEPSTIIAAQGTNPLQGPLS